MPISTRTGRTTLAAAVPVALGIVSLALSLSSRAEEERETDDVAAEVAALYRRSCLPCHQPPDPAFEADRIWLRQVRRTA